MKFVKILYARTMPNFVYIILDQYAYARSVPIIVYIIRYRPRTDRTLCVARTVPIIIYITHPIGAELPSEGADKKCPEVNLSP